MTYARVIIPICIKTQTGRKLKKGRDSEAIRAINQRGGIAPTLLKKQLLGKAEELFLLFCYFYLFIHLVNDAVLLCLFSRHKEVALHVFLNLLN